MGPVKKSKQRSWEEVNASIRRDWGDVKPYTRVHESKKYKKPKHKKREEESHYD